MNTHVVDSDGSEPVYTLDEVLAAVGIEKFQALLLAYAGLGAMAEAMEVMILSFIGSSVKAEWGLSSGQESLITTMVFAGMLIGAYLWGILSDNYGRRSIDMSYGFTYGVGLLCELAELSTRISSSIIGGTNYIGSLVLILFLYPTEEYVARVGVGLLSVAVVTSIFAFLSAVSPNYVLLVLFRMVVGIGLGGGPVYSTWFLEFVPVRNRGIWMVIFSTFWTVGTILEASLAWIGMEMAACSSAPCFAAFVLYFLTIETPRYLYMHGKISDAHDVLKKMARVNNKELPSGKLVSEKMRNLNEDFTPLEGTLLLHNREQETKSGYSSIFTLFSPSLAKTTLLLWVVYFGNSFSYYGVVLMTSELGSGESKCHTSSHPELLTDSSLYINVFITSLAELSGLVLSAILVDKIGRRMSMVLMYSCGFLCLLPLMFQRQQVVAISLLFGARMFITGNYTVAGIYCPELYPTSVRTTGAGVASAVGRVAGMICPLVAVELVSGCHQMAAIPELVCFSSQLKPKEES